MSGSNGGPRDRGIEDRHLVHHLAQRRELAREHLSVAPAVHTGERRSDEQSPGRLDDLALDLGGGARWRRDHDRGEWSRPDVRHRRRERESLVRRRANGGRGFSAGDGARPSSRSRSSGAPPMHVTGGPGSTRRTSSVIRSAPSTHMSAAIVDLPAPEWPTKATTTSSTATALACEHDVTAQVQEQRAHRSREQDRGATPPSRQGPRRITTWVRSSRSRTHRIRGTACGSRTRFASRCTSSLRPGCRTRR